MANVFVEYWDVWLVYGLAILLLYLFRSKFEFQGIIALLRTKLGLDFMKRTGERYARFLNGLGYVSIFIGYLGMAFITVYLFYGLYSLFFIPDALPVLSPVLPGVKIPGSPIEFPLWYTLIGLFFAVVVHEAAHGIYAAVYKIRIKSSGLAFFGPLPGAFVEPDEKVVVKRGKREQLAMLSAGPFSNVLLAMLMLGLLIGVGSVAQSMIMETGVGYTEVQNNTSASMAGFPAPGLITALDGVSVTNSAALTDTLATKEIGNQIIVTINGTNYTATLGEHPDREGRAYLGVLGAQTEGAVKNADMQWFYDVVIIVGKVILWTYIISFGIGIANLIPAGPLDGGRMFLLFLQSRFEEKRARAIFSRWSWMLLFVIIVLVLVPILKAVLF